MEDYKTAVISRKKLGTVNELVKRVERRDDTKIQPHELKVIFETLIESAEQVRKDKGEHVKIFAIVNTGAGYHTFKTPNDILEENEYWDGKVKDKEKFTSFDYVDFHIFKEQNAFLKN